MSILGALESKSVTRRACRPETTQCPSTPLIRLASALHALQTLRERARADANRGSKAELRDLELQWLGLVESYKYIEQAGRFLKDVRVRQSAANEKLAQTRDGFGRRAGASTFPPAVNGASLADLLKVLVRAAIEHTDGKARAAFYLADVAGLELRHIIGMPDAYARCVDGFAISTQSLACGLAVATGRSVITPDVSREPRWSRWLWLAEEFDYRACWSFPVATCSGKVVGSFAMYHREPREATPRDLDIASVLTRTAAALIPQHATVSSSEPTLSTY
jgi:hypothetical protein